MIRLLNEGNELRELDSFDSEHPKYILDWNESTSVLGCTLYRIIYRNGRKGGFLESYNNLSQEGRAKVYGNAKVFSDAVVSDNAEIYGDAWVYGRAKVLDNAQVCGNARVRGNAEVSGSDVLNSGELAI